jgi:S1-C subfamily serine protease
MKVVARSSSGSSFGSGVWVAEDYVATCAHVVKGGEGSIEIWVSPVRPNRVIDLQHGGTFNANFTVYRGTVVKMDEDADVAILRANPSPFKGVLGMILKTPEYEMKVEPEVAAFSTDLPQLGEASILAGFPLARPDFIVQRGNVAGIGFPNENKTTRKAARVFLSLVSNPGNSGGPVFNHEGRLIGLLEGNLPSPMRDEQSRDVPYFRPKRAANGAPMLDPEGHPMLEFGTLYENSGISVVVPVYFVKELLDEATKGSPTTPPH